jgi:GrpB-like predicted nucleotidyltransferase (UPF0157 family)
LERRLDQVIIGERQPGPVKLVEYDPGWPRQFERIRAQLVGALGGTARTIEHIGSTAVTGLAAKPIIDVLVTVDVIEDESSYLPSITRLGYELRVRERGHRMLRRPARDAHLHVCTDGSREHRDYVLLRDRLRDSSDDRAAYAALKRRLALENWPDVNCYAEAKGPLIAQMLERARSLSG